MQAEAFWFISIFLIGDGVRRCVREANFSSLISGQAAEIRKLKTVSGLLLEIEETFMAGLVPEFSRWEQIQKLPSPWGKLSSESLDGLRSMGGALLPTLRRLRALAQQHATVLSEARAKSAQSIAQAMVSALMVPLFGASLYSLLPGIPDHPVTWIAVCGGGLLLTLIGAIWMMQIADAARWGGLKGEERMWFLSAFCAGERFLAGVRSGMPADLAWVQVCDRLSLDSPALAVEWGASIWQVREETGRGNHAPSSRELLIGVGGAVKKAVQLSLMEGRPCTERVESAFEAVRVQLKSCIDRELGTLPTRSLKPLFLCVAPSLLSLLAFGLALSWASIMD